MTYEVFVLEGQPLMNTVGVTKPRTFVGSLKFGELVDRYEIPYKDHEEREGYQRKASPTRVRKLAQDLMRGNVDLPTAVLLSVRNQDLMPRLDSSDRYILSLPDNGDSPLYVVDGQHRLEALKQAMTEDPEGDWGEFKVHTVFMFGADENAEMHQFHTVNVNAKSVPTDLAFDLLKTLADKDDDYKTYLVAKGEDWKRTGYKLTEMVAKRRAWRGKIRFPNQDKRKTLIKSNAFVSSLRRVLEQENFAKYTMGQRAEIIDAFWQGIGIVLTPCFERPDDYNIQKTVGVSVINLILPRVLSYAQDSSSPLAEPETYANILQETLSGLSGDNRLGGVAEGAAFWRVGESGASGVYTNYAGRRVLTARLLNDLDQHMSEEYQ